MIEQGLVLSWCHRCMQHPGPGFDQIERAVWLGTASSEGTASADIWAVVGLVAE